MPQSIASNCSVDVSAKLQAWIDATPDNSTLRLEPDACYRSDEPLTFTDRHRLLLEGNGATLRAFTMGTANRAHLIFDQGNDLTVRNLIVQGANSNAGTGRSAHVIALEHQAGFRISGTSGVLLDKVTVSDVYGDFVYIGSGATRRNSENVTVERSNFQRSGRQGIAITAAVNVALADNTISGAAQSLIDLESNSHEASIWNIDILRNRTGTARHFWLANKGLDARIGDISIIGNQMTTATGGLFFIYGGRTAHRGPFLIQDNRLIASDAVHDEGSSGAFFFVRIEKVAITGNDVSFPRGMTAIELRSSRDVTVRDNHFVGQGRMVLADRASDYHVS